MKQQIFPFNHAVGCVLRVQDSLAPSQAQDSTMPVRFDRKLEYSNGSSVLIFRDHSLLTLRRETKSKHFLMENRIHQHGFSAGPVEVCQLEGHPDHIALRVSERGGIVTIRVFSKKEVQIQLITLEPA